MREIVAKNITSKDRLKKDVSIFEILQKDGIVAKLKKRFLYFVMDVVEVKDPLGIDSLLEERQLASNTQPPHRSILRLHDTKEGKDVFLYKAMGDLYVVLNNKVFFIRLLHYTRMEFIRNPQNNYTKEKSGIS